MKIKDEVKQLKEMLTTGGLSEEEGLWLLLWELGGMKNVPTPKGLLDSLQDRLFQNRVKEIRESHQSFFQQANWTSWVYQYFVSGTEEQQAKGIFYTPNGLQDIWWKKP